MATSRPSALARLFGLGSVFGKTLRDSTPAALGAAGLLLVLVVGGGLTMSVTYGSPATRLELGMLSRDIPPVLRGFYGNPVRVDTLGGFLGWHYGPYFALIGGLWSLLALSSTLAGEAARGSLDMVLAGPSTRRRVALAKVFAHVTALAAVVTLTGLATWVTGVVYGVLPGDPIAPAAAAGFAIGLLVRSLVTGSMAFAIAAVFGKGAGAGIAGAVMAGSYVMYGYRTVFEPFDAISAWTPWAWTANHLPLVEQTDWPGVAAAAALTLVLLAVGVEGFARRDVGVTVSLPGPRFPRRLAGTRGPLARSLGELLPTAWWWAFGLAAYGLVMAASVRGMMDMLASAPDLAIAFRTMIPDVDMTTPEGYLQLAFVDMGFVLVGLSVASLVGARLGDEGAGRLEMFLASGVGRVRWILATWLAVAAGVGAVTLALAVAVGTGVWAAGYSPWQPMAGTLVLGAYGLALAGVGVALGGVGGLGGLTRLSALGGPGSAGVVVMLATVLTFVLDLFAPVLRLPDWVADLALTTHLGLPMVGSWEPAGLAACAVLWVGGLAVGVAGFARRDIGR